MAEVDITNIDRDLLAVTRLWSQLMHILSHPNTIHMPSNWMANGRQSAAFQGETSAFGGNNLAPGRWAAEASPTCVQMPRKPTRNLSAQYLNRVSIAAAGAR